MSLICPNPAALLRRHPGRPPRRLCRDAVRLGRGRRGGRADARRAGACARLGDGLVPARRIPRGGGRHGSRGPSLAHGAKTRSGGPAGAGLKLAIDGRAPQSAAPPSAFVEALFDQYAEKFDHALVETLGYRVPELLAEAIARTGRPVRAGARPRLRHRPDGRAAQAVLRPPRRLRHLGGNAAQGALPRASTTGWRRPTCKRFAMTGRRPISSPRRTCSCMSGRWMAS